MKRERRWCHLALLAAFALVPLPVSAQDVPTLVAAIDATADLTVSSEIVRHEDEALGILFGEDLEAAMDFGARSVTEFRVSNGTGGSTVRLYELIDSAAAFGWFAHEREYDEADYEPLVLGAEAYRNSDRMVFWQSRFVVYLEGAPETSLEVGRTLSSAITGPSRKPTVSTLLPTEGRVPASERYLLTPSVIEDRLGIDADLLGLENSVESASAVYQDGEASATLALFHYPTPQLARIHSEAWLAASDGTQPARQDGLLFGIVTASDSAALAESLLSGLRVEFDVIWNEPPPDPLTIQQIVLTAFAWIGIALAFTLVVGMGFGGLRVYVKKRYPTQILGGELDTEFLQLNINQSVTRRRLPD